MSKKDIPKDHPRYQSLMMRAKIEELCDEGIVAKAGPIAHGRGEAFDYLLGEKTSISALKAIEAASAMLVRAKNPVLSVNGNAAALVPNEIVACAKALGAKIEANVFYGRVKEREEKIAEILQKAGADMVYGVEPEAQVPDLNSARGRVSREGIYSADVVLVSIEDGDRTDALRKMGKKVIAIDLNPLSRTALDADITIVDNVIRAYPLIKNTVVGMKFASAESLDRVINDFDNRKNIGRGLLEIEAHLEEKAQELGAL